MSESIGQDLAFLSWRPRCVEKAISVMLNTSTAWPLSIALDSTISAAHAGIGRSTGQTQGMGGCSRHDAELSGDTCDVVELKKLATMQLLPLRHNSSSQQFAGSFHHKDFVRQHMKGNSQQVFMTSTKQTKQ